MDNFLSSDIQQDPEPFPPSQPSFYFYTSSRVPINDLTKTASGFLITWILDTWPGHHDLDFIILTHKVTCTSHVLM
jgi:hypothetical protein